MLACFSGVPDPPDNAFLQYKYGKRATLPVIIHIKTALSNQRPSPILLRVQLLRLETQL